MPDLNITDNRFVLGVLGPTASGKTALAIELALRYGGEVVSCDAMQVYRGMDIGTAKPDMDERRGVPHHMLDVAEPSMPYSAADYAAQAGACVEDILSRGRLPIVCGGTGLYLDALIHGLHGAGAAHDSPVRAELERFALSHGAAALYAELERVDPDSAARIHANDRRRIVRALEVYRQTGIPLSVHHERSRAVPPRWNTLLLGIRFSDRQVLYRRIEQRVEQMLEAGLEDEARAVLSAVPPPCHTAMQAIGYKEFAAVFSGAAEPGAAADSIKQATRRLAKRQMTWFGKTSGLRWLEAGNQEIGLLAQSTQIVEECGLR